MSIVAKVGVALPQLLDTEAEQAAQDSGVIVRKRIFTGVSLARTLVLGFLQKPDATDEDLAQMAAQCGAPVTPQAIEQRFTRKLENFVKNLFERATRLIVGSPKTLAPILERFSNVTILDSSTITVPDERSDEYAGCGGSYGGGAAAFKLQTELDLRSGALNLQIEPGRSSDGGTTRQHVRRGEGSLRLADLGYFNLEVLADMAENDEYFLSRVQPGTAVLSPQGEVLELCFWLAQQQGPFIDRQILLGKQQRLPCRLIAWRVPPEVANRRRQKLRQEHLSKNGKEPSAERLALCDWTMLVTNVPPELLSPAEAAILYRARWQVELLFKRWKSQDLVALLTGSTVVRQMVKVWSRLLAALVQHWLVVASVWGDPSKSWSKVSEAIRAFVSRLAAALDKPSELCQVLADLAIVLAKTCQRNKRSKPGTFELLNDAALLEFRLT
jgi:hypothetical protein